MNKNTMRKLIRRVVFVATLLVAATAVAEAPPIIPFQGFLTDAEGTPRDGDVVVEITLYDAAVDGNVLYTESQVIEADAGYFTAELGLGDALDLAIFRDNGEVWAEVVVDDEALDPRIQLGTVPYAAWAEWAADAATLDGRTADELAATDWGDVTGIPAELTDGDDVGPTYDAGAGLTLTDGTFAVDGTAVQLRLSDSCAGGEFLQGVAADGTVSCGTPADSDTTYTAGGGLTLSGNAFSVDSSVVQGRVAGTCAPGSSIRAIAADGTVTCEADDDTTYAAGTGLTLTDGTFDVDASAVQARISGSCPTGQAIRLIEESGAVVCQPIGGGSNYDAGPGIDITDGTVSIADLGVGPGMIADDAVGSRAINDDSVTNRHLIDGSVRSAEVLDRSLTEQDISLQGTGVVSTTDITSAAAIVFARFLWNGNVPFERFRVMFTANGVTGPGAEIFGGSGTATIDLGFFCQTEYGGDQEISITATPSGGYPWVYMSDEFNIGTGPTDTCFVALKVVADDPANPVVIRDVQLVPVF